MEAVNQIIIFIDFAIRPFLILIATMFAIILALRKFGTNVSARWNVKSELFMPERISDIALSNHKDKPVIIYSIAAVFNKDLYIELKKFSPPMVLKPLESIGILTEPYSTLYLSNDKFEPNFLNSDYELYLQTDKGIVQCNKKLLINFRETFREVLKGTYTFNRHVYDDSVKFIIVYELGGEQKTAFVSNSGFIGNEWEMPIKTVKTENLIENLVELLDSQLASYIPTYNVYEVKTPGLTTKIRSKSLLKDGKFIILE